MPTGLYLSGNNQDDLALAQLATLPRGQWTDNIRELDARLQSDKVIRQRQPAGRDSGQETQAIALPFNSSRRWFATSLRLRTGAAARR